MEKEGDDMSYTPGPWNSVNGSIKAIDHGRYFTVAQVKSQKLTDEGNVANANLIAAAPDLLEAVKRLTEPSPPDFVFAWARQIVVKAEGRTE